MEYIGEHAFIGQLGNGFLVLAFASIVLAAVSYFFAAQRDSLEQKNWIKIARLGFSIHTVAVLAVCGILFFMLYNRYYEYGYVAKNASSDMPLRYILSSFWGAQEGSFLLWIFWHVVIGNILFRTAKTWEAPTMAVFSAVQVLLVSMLLGVYVFDFRFGSNPFVLKRELMLDARMLWNYLPDYMSFDPSFKDGTGLNPLLRNYWMTIHPPTLFLGFASTLVPFCFAIAALWKKRYMEWIKPALPWTYFGVFILGAGILMGGIWAYESLSFGGFWAWDPVENASFVPWLVLVGGAHVMLVNQKKNNSLFTSFFLIMMSFVLVMYSTFLTRTGVLGDSSVHSFTGEGMLGILLVYLLLSIYLPIMMLLIDKRLKLYFTAFVASLAIFELITDNTAVTTIVAGAGIFLFLLYAHRSHFPWRNKKAEEKGEWQEEELWSREFWMFIGGLVLLLSAIQIIVPTSTAVFNLIFGTEYAPYNDEERNAFYNSWQEPFAFVVCILVAMGQFLKYTPGSVSKMEPAQLKAFRKKSFREFGKKMLLSAGAAIVVSVLVTMGIGFQAAEIKHIMFLFAALFALFANFDYLIRFIKGKLNFAGASIAHIGFAILMIGTLISQSKKEVISENIKAGHNLQYYNKKFDNNTDIQLFKGSMTEMGPYFVNFKGVKAKKPNNFFIIDYYEKAPRKYRKGDTVRVREALLVANKNHTATEKFLDDLDKYWTPIEQPYGNMFHTHQKWSSFEAGKKIGDISPFMQLSTSSRPSPEPGTKHFLTHDIFTHLVYADPVTMKGNKKTEYHSALKPMTSHRDKPFFADRYNMFVTDILPVTNHSDYNLKVKDTAAIVYLEFFELNDTMLTRGYKAEQLFVKKFGKYRIRGELELPDLKLKIMDASFTMVQKPVVNITEDADWMKPFGIDTLKGEDLGVDSTVIALINADTSLTKGLNVDRMWTANHPPAEVIDEIQISDNLEDVEMTFIFAPREFILLRAMQFPYINVLWIGCVLMVLGTLMSVIYRVKNNRRTEKKTAS
jgi:cytochrome c-type biogenesis protein CcmF